MASSRACPAAACPCHNANCNDADDDNDEDVTRPYEDQDCHVLHMTTHIGLHTWYAPDIPTRQAVQTVD